MGPEDSLKKRKVECAIVLWRGRGRRRFSERAPPELAPEQRVLGDGRAEGVLVLVEAPGDPGRDVVERAVEHELARAAARGRLGRKRVIQVLFNMSVPRARVPENTSTLRYRSER